MVNENEGLHYICMSFLKSEFSLMMIYIYIYYIYKRVQCCNFGVPGRRNPS